MKDGSISVNPTHLKALLRIAAVQDIRYYLNGVLVQATVKDGKFYVATDGHRLAVFHETWGGEPPRDLNIIIPRDVIDQFRFSKGIRALLSPFDGKKWTLDPQTEASLNFSPVDGKYPEWRKVLPTKVSGEPGDYNLGYVADFVALAHEAGMAIHGIGVLLWQNGSDQALVTANEKDFFGVLMPVRASDHKRGGAPIPEWLKASEGSASRLEQPF